MAGSNDVHTNSPTVALTKSLSGIDFPASKQEIVQYAQKNNVDQDTLGRLNNLPEAQYENMADVLKGFGQS